jgi:hypothetical protein
MPRGCFPLRLRREIYAPLHKELPHRRRQLHQVAHRGHYGRYAGKGGEIQFYGVRQCIEPLLLGIGGGIAGEGFVERRGIECLRIDLRDIKLREVPPRISRLRRQIGALRCLRCRQQTLKKAVLCCWHGLSRA